MARKKAEKQFDMTAIENSKVIDVELNSEMKKSWSKSTDLNPAVRQGFRFC